METEIQQGHGVNQTPGFPAVMVPIDKNQHQRDIAELERVNKFLEIDKQAYATTLSQRYNDVVFPGFLHWADGDSVIEKVPETYGARGALERAQWEIQTRGDGYPGMPSVFMEDFLTVYGVGSGIRVGLRAAAPRLVPIGVSALKSTLKEIGELALDGVFAKYGIPSPTIVLNFAQASKKGLRGLGGFKSARNRIAGGTADALSGVRLNKHLSQLEKYGKGGYKQLENGRFRYYGELTPATNPGELAGGRLVREWDPTTGTTRNWYEVLDHQGRIRSVAPKPPTHPFNHHIFDENGIYQGRR